jgi:acetyl-CoA synthetase
MIANVQGRRSAPAPWGGPFPGWRPPWERTDRTEVRIEEPPDVEGELASGSGWPSMFRGYLHRRSATGACFAGDWYLTGDLVPGGMPTGTSGSWDGPTT